MSVVREGSMGRWRLSVLLAIPLIALALFVWISGGLGDASPQHQALAASTGGGGAIQFRLAQWADQDADWQFGDLNKINSAYHETESIPYVLEIDNAVPSTTYAFQLRYDCDKGGVNAFDFLPRYDRDRGTAPATALGINPASPDDTEPISDDPTH